MPKGVYKRKPLTEEHRRNIGKSNKKPNSGQFKKGEKRSDDFKEKCRINTLLGITGMKEKNHSEETKKKISKNNVRYWLDRKRPKISQKMKGNQYAQGNIPHNKGKSNFNWIGKKNPNWKNGITPLTQRIRHCFKYRQWRSDVFERDNYTCQECSKRGVYLEVDHYPKRFSEIFHKYKIRTLEQALRCKEFWNISNGRTLCRKCHNLTKNKKQHEYKYHYCLYTSVGA